MGAAKYSVTERTARLTAVALLLNGQPLVMIAAMYGAVELPPSLHDGADVRSTRVLLFPP